MCAYLARLRLERGVPCRHEATAREMDSFCNVDRSRPIEVGPVRGARRGLPSGGKFTYLHFTYIDHLVGRSLSSVDCGPSLAWLPAAEADC